MESELNKLIELEQRNELENQNADADEDIMRSSFYIDEFEKKVKSRMKILGDDSDDSDDGPISKNKKPSSKINKSLQHQSIQRSEEFSAQKPPVKKPGTSNANPIPKPSSASTKPSSSSKEYAVDGLDEALNSKSDNLKDKKIRELAHKNKGLFVALEKEKGLRQKAETHLAKLMKEAEDLLESQRQENFLKKKDQNPLFSETSSTTSVGSRKPSRESSRGKKGATTEESAGPEDWKAKYQQADKKIQELRVEKQNIKNELNKAMRIIAREIGENFNIDQVLMEENSWKGRAQQIQILNGKIKDLQSKIGNISLSRQGDSMYSDARSELNSASGTKADDRRKEIEGLRNQVEGLKSENELLQSKIKAVNSRKNTLEQEIREVKAEYDKNKKFLLDKSDNDDKYISALKAELEKAKSSQPPIQTKIIYKNQENYGAKENFANGASGGGDDLGRLKKENQALNAELEKKEKMIKELISDKLKFSSMDSLPSTEKPPGDEKYVEKLEAEVRSLKKKNEELSKFSGGDTQKTLKDLSSQNAQLRLKIDDLQQKLSSKK